MEAASSTLDGGSGGNKSLSSFLCINVTSSVWGRGEEEEVKTQSRLWPRWRDLFTIGRRSFQIFFSSFPLSVEAGTKIRWWLTRRRRSGKEREKKGISFYGADAPCSVISVFFYSLCECVSVSESPCRTFWDIEAVGKSQLQTFGRKRGKKQQLCRTNSARSNLKTVFFPNWKFMTRPALSLSLFISFLSPFWFFSSFLFNSLSDCSDNAKYKVRPLISAQLANWPCKGSNETCAVPDVGGGDVQVVVVVVVVTSESPLMIGPHATCGK